ncbi:MAG: AmmeMemoRadiSam system radical SAM enzyme [Candidatus Lokiarchaeota archaeon]|nr:AmmeMemoRadiSam system radical SAM enzyme [Candidatus Lokiarchaeota archaeon]
MKKEALLYDARADGKVQCHACARECVIPEGKFGICETRVNSGGKCYSLIYGELSAEAIDPIEKKPLFHFYPGHDIYSISSAGCSFKCLNCQNYHLSQVKSNGYDEPSFMTGGMPMRLRFKSPEDLIRDVVKSGSKLLAFTYNEPMIWLEYIIDVGKLAHEQGIKTVLVTNGYTTARALELLLPHVDAANVDIKAFDDAFYKKVCKVPSFKPVLDCVKMLHDNGKSIEITNLLIPTLNDSPGMIRNLCDWVIDNIGKEVPLHFSAYHPDYELDLPPTPVDTLLAARKIALDAGLVHVYVGNARVPGGENTSCPKCNAVVIARQGYSIVEVRLGKDNTCISCGGRVNIAGEAKKSRTRFFG